jgi:hypothetical protein
MSWPTVGHETQFAGCRAAADRFSAPHGDTLLLFPPKSCSIQVHGTSASLWPLASGGCGCVVRAYTEKDPEMY